MNRITIKFIHDHSPYIKGDVATFFEKEANRLIDRGLAMIYGSETRRAKDAAALKNVPGAPETRHIPGPDNTRIPGGKGPSKVEGGASGGRKCGECGKPGHTKANCPEKKS